ncbi:protein LSM12 homolog [Galendromus occidentalis]|uniref:Protein LSM12 homolog n=1 Tax=Galendromus occidentalis TaxID=34638 RepID=A0AAJ6QP63_9ACAR|nr:protein LSM12 homolog [Galendromus occidentalis]
MSASGEFGIGMNSAGGNGGGGANSVAADIPELFQVGCVVTVENLCKERFQGEVIAFDEEHKALVLKCQTADRKTNDVRVVNLLCVTNINIESEAGTTAPSPPAQINIEKVRARIKKNNDERRKMAAAIAKGVSGEGISLFLAIRKTIEEVTWHDRDILVMNSVRIQPPYQPENCVPSHDAAGLDHQSVAHVKNIVEKHLKDLKQMDVSSLSKASLKDKP